MNEPEPPETVVNAERTSVAKIVEPEVMVNARTAFVSYPLGNGPTRIFL